MVTEELYDALVANKSACKACGQIIYWATTTSGKHIPLERWPEEWPGAGQFRLRADGTTLRADYLDRADQKLGKSGHVSHFSKCPEADVFRRAQ